jgi:hypothetical protein
MRICASSSRTTLVDFCDLAINHLDVDKPANLGVLALVGTDARLNDLRRVLLISWSDGGRKLNFRNNFRLHNIASENVICNVLPLGDSGNPAALS